MSWPLLTLTRRGFRDSDQWGSLLLMNSAGNWEMLSNSYELPWQENASGQSQSKKSRIAEGVYQLHARSDGNKGWRLELVGTGHRQNIQVHRAHRSMYIEGCILPVSFIDFRNAPASGVGPVQVLKKGDLNIEQRSVQLMHLIRQRYDLLKVANIGNPTISIQAMLPAYERPRGGVSVSA